MGLVRAHVILPVKLAAEIDNIAGPRGRSAFLVECAEKEVRRLKLLAFLENTAPAWNADEHEELRELGSAVLIRNQRQHKSNRQLLLEAWAEERNS